MRGIVLPIVAFAACFPTVLFAAGEQSTLYPVDLRCELLVNPQGIDVRQPGLAWRSEARQQNARGLVQRAYQIAVASSAQLLETDHADLWDSGKVVGGQSIQVIYGGKPLQSFASCYWRVRVWDGRDRPSTWSETAQWSTGPLRLEDWGAKWIGKDGGENGADLLADAAAKWIWREPGAATSAPAESRYFRRVVTIPKDKTIRSATFRMTADDGFRLIINGSEVGKSDSHTNPVSVDVTANLVIGSNVVAVAAFNKPGPPVNPAGLIGSLRIEFVEGDHLSLVTDGQWRSSAELRHGWDAAAFDDSAWPPASVLGDYGMAPWGVIGSGAEHRRLPARMLRREFQLQKRITRATAYVCGMGFFELYLNGRKVSDHVMDPAISNYAKHVCYVTFDVTDQIRQGDNAVGVILGNGRFFAPRVNVPAPTHTFGYPKLLLKLRT